MMTHNWSNKFLHLMAALFADIMAEDCYDVVLAQMLEPAGLDILREKLRRKDMLERAYWVCAFSVNQHASICGGFGPSPAEGTAERLEWEAKTRDTVTGAKYPLCGCEEPKFFNDNFV